MFGQLRLGKLPIGWILQDQVSLLILILSLASTALEGVGVWFPENAELNPKVKKILSLFMGTHVLYF